MLRSIIYYYLGDQQTVHVTHWLAAGVDPNLPDDLSRIPPCQEAATGDGGIMGQQIEAGAVSNSQDLRGASSLHTAIESDAGRNILNLPSRA